MSLVAWFEIVAGVAIIGIWVMLLATGKVPELAEGDLEIRFHLVAENLTALLLLAGGIALLAADGTGVALVAALGLGALAYTTINSAGYYAQRRERVPVVMFGLLSAATIAGAVVLITSS